MSVVLNPYISFRDNARDALTFYASVFGGEPVLMTMSEGGMPHEASEAENVMHGQLDTPNGLTLMAADTPASMEHSPGGAVSISLSGDDEGTLTGYWEKLADGALNVWAPLNKAPWGDTFGGLVDQFGVNWMVNISAPRDPE